MGWFGEDSDVIDEERAEDWNSEFGEGVFRELSGGGYLSDEDDSGVCGYCGRDDGASVMAIDSEGVVSCWKCARSNGEFDVVEEDLDDTDEDDCSDESNEDDQ